MSTNCRSSATRGRRALNALACAERQSKRNTHEGQPMASLKDEDDDRPKKKIVHEIGQELTLLSVKELQERIALLKEEIARLEAAINRKQASRNVADSYFKK